VSHKEAPYAFRRYLETVHQSDQRDPDAMPRQGEVIIDETWTIAIAESPSPLVFSVAADLQHYFQVSMQLDLDIGRYADISGLATHGERKIVLATADEVPGVSAVPEEARGYRVEIGNGRIVLCGRDDRGAAQASYYLEDLVNLRGAPFLAPGSESRTSLFSPRMVHSGWGLDDFPDGHLNQIAHAGIDAILVFATNPHRSPDEYTHRQPDRHSLGRHNDFNVLVDRAAAFGIDVYLYAYPHGKHPLHPDDPGAERFYEDAYGALFAACPRAKGLILVGESVEFPSKDPRTTGRLRLDPVPDGLPPDKPNPGWWPCTDYPQWLALVTKVCRRHNPDADIVFWTYNWGWAPEADRVALIRALPTDITLQVTFEMFEPIEHDGVTNACVDYTASSVGPGRYFASEAAVAHERGITLSTMANTGGLTWDFGVIPYQPIPQQWNRRHQALKAAKREWGLQAVMESHHFGWWPSIASELAKWNYWSPETDPAATIHALAARDFGAGAEIAVAAWQAWSDASTDYIPTNEDQYGPFRIGPAYPLTFLSVPQLPVDEFAMFGDLIVKTPYRPENLGTVRKTAGAIRIDAEIASLTRMKARWEEGNRLLGEAIAAAPAHKAERNARILNLGRYIPHAIQTAINVKRWWKLTNRVLVEADREGAAALLDEMVVLAREEIDNCEASIPIVEADSRLGWEPSMEYLGDAGHIRWKLAHLRHVLDHEIPRYRDSLAV